MMRSLKRLLTPFSLAGLAIGAAGGFLYYYFVGCRSGSCPIWSSPWISTLWGAIAGYLLGDLFSGKGKKKSPQGEKDLSGPDNGDRKD